MFLGSNVDQESAKDVVEHVLAKSRGPWMLHKAKSRSPVFFFTTIAVSSFVTGLFGYAKDSSQIQSV